MKKRKKRDGMERGQVNKRKKLKGLLGRELRGRKDKRRI